MAGLAFLSEKTAQNKTLVALVFASAALNSHLPALGEEMTASTESVIQQLANNSLINPESRSWSLLRLANDLLDGRDTLLTEAQIKGLTGTDVVRPSKSYERMLVSWTESVLGGLTPSNGLRKLETKSIARFCRVDAPSLAATAIDDAININAEVSNSYARLRMLLIARCLYKRLGNAAGEGRCDNSLEQTIQACEKSRSKDPELIRTVSSVLNLMAYEIIPIRIADHQLQQEKLKMPVGNNDFEACENLKLRAAAIADRLAPTDDIRRKVHRDLAIWYMELGKHEKAEKEKEILFELVGSRDEKILYPTSFGCGMLTWWQVRGAIMQGLCGMG
jgi:hypothetical protein